jgi:hypothetical protein
MLHKKEKVKTWNGKYLMNMNMKMKNEYLNTFIVQISITFEQLNTLINIYDCYKYTLLEFDVYFFIIYLLYSYLYSLSFFIIKYISTLRDIQNYGFFLMTTYVFFNAENDSANDYFGSNSLLKFDTFD